KYVSPLTIASDGAVEVSSGNAIFGTAGNSWSVENHGTVIGPAVGVYFNDSGTVSNLAGLIDGGTGIVITGTAANVINQATVVGTAHYGIKLAAGGNATNSAGGLITGAAAGVYARSGAATVINS